MKSSRIVLALAATVGVIALSGCSGTTDTTPSASAEPSQTASVNPSPEPSETTSTASPSPTASLSVKAEKETSFTDKVAETIKAGASADGVLPAVTMTDGTVLIGSDSSLGKVPPTLSLMVLGNENNTGMCVLGTGGDLPLPITLEVSATSVKAVDECPGEYSKMLIVETAA